MGNNTSRNQGRLMEAFGVGIMMLALLIFVALISYHPSDFPNSGSRDQIQNWVGEAGAVIAFHLHVHTIGYACLIFPVLIFLFGWYLFLQRALLPFLRISVYLLTLGIFLSTALAMPEALSEEGSKYGVRFSGLLGLFFAENLYKYLGTVGSFIVLITFLIIFLLTATSWSMREAVLGLRESIRSSMYRITEKQKERRKRAKMKTPVKAGSSSIPIHTEPETVSPAESLKTAPPSRPDRKIRKTEDVSKIDQSAAAQEIKKPAAANTSPGPERAPAGGEYHPPPLHLLHPPAEDDKRIDREALERRAHFLEEKLREFDVQSTVTGIQPGPVITRFEVSPAPGVKVNKYLNIQDDLALVMRATRVRVVAPIPGKAAVGIEIPNEKPSMVTLREILSSKAFQKSDDELPVALGKTIEGKPYVTDLAQMPHLLVAGATGSGKSVCLNTILMSILYRWAPDKVKLLLIDPKKLELNLFKKLRNHHLTTRDDLNEEVITTVENAVAVLRSLESEMERRYRILAKVGVRNIQQFNRTAAGQSIQTPDGEKVLPTLPYIILVVDELADLMLTGAREIEDPIARLAQMSRAVGVHLILATQRPSVDVITGVIKANFPARIAFQVAAKTDSRTILDRNGAEKLLGRGDMLFLNSRVPEPIRIHGAYVTTEEVQRVVAHIAQQPRQALFRLQGGAPVRSVSQSGHMSMERDELFWEAAKLVVRHNQASASLLQRRLRVGYARAGRLIDELEDAGIVGPFEGSKSREVLVDEAYIDTLYETEMTKNQSEDI
ncbi:DNA translocase FtsK [bacterium]|nr:DNA translocase FtsK [bacterium]